jgi:predicted nucleic acid-binding protein
MVATILVDTGVWYAFCDPRDRVVSREVAEDLHGRVEAHSVLVPWPVAYETLSTRFVRNRLAMERFERELRSPRVEFVDDAPFRDEAIAQSFEWSLRRGRPLSLVDCVLRLLLDDVRTRIRYLATFNPRDFNDICAKRKIELWSQ